MIPIEPECPSMLHYFQLSREYDTKGLLFRDWRKLLWYWEKYEKITHLGKFDESLIKIKK